MSIQNLLVNIIRVSALPSVKIAGFFVLYSYPNSTLNIQHSTLNSTFNTQHSTLNSTFFVPICPRISITFALRKYQ